MDSHDRDLTDRDLTDRDLTDRDLTDRDLTDGDLTDRDLTDPDLTGRDPTQRFSDRVSDYTRYRPGYPDGVGLTLRAEAGLAPSAVVADLGSGTGISTDLLLDCAHTVYAVEPNPAMRAEAERRLGSAEGFRSVAGTAERTGLPDASVDVVVAAQAFHWFDAAEARREVRRILRPGGQVALLWNRRLVDATPFLQAYEALLLDHATDYRQVDHRNVGADRLAAFFGGPFRSRIFPNRQEFDYEGLKGRLLSSSYAPAPGQPGHDTMIAALEALFAEHGEGGRVAFLYETELHWGPLNGG